VSGPRVLTAIVGVLLFAVAAAYLAFGLMTASYTFACDFFAYAGAADRLLAQQPIYDLSHASTGECGIYQYPPPFVLVALPFALPDPVIGSWAWIAFLVTCYWLAIAAMPVRREVKVAVGLVGALSWPFIFGVRIGQVGTILLLLFALGWRWLDRPERVGVLSGLGFLVKVQPGLLGLWLLARQQWRGVIAAILTVLAGATVAALVGLIDWIPFLTLVRQLSDAATVPVNLSLSATAVRFGLPVELAGVTQLAVMGALVVLVVLAARRLSAEAGFLATVVASQIISPIVWDHYAIALLLPVAWLCARRQWWALAIPVSQAWVLLPTMPLWIYPLGYLVILGSLFVVDRRAGAPAAVRSGAPA
jgi:hypothetical protein